MPLERIASLPMRNRKSRSCNDSAPICRKMELEKMRNTKSEPVPNGVDDDVIALLERLKCMNGIDFSDEFASILWQLEKGARCIQSQNEKKNSPSNATCGCYRTNLKRSNFQHLYSNNHSLLNREESNKMNSVLSPLVIENRARSSSLSSSVTMYSTEEDVSPGESSRSVSCASTTSFFSLSEREDPPTYIDPPSSNGSRTSSQWCLATVNKKLGRQSSAEDRWKLGSEDGLSMGNECEVCNARQKYSEVNNKKRGSVIPVQYS